MTLLQNATFLGIMQATNTYTSGLFGVFIIVAIGLAMYFGLQQIETQRNSVVGAMFAVFVVSFFLRLLNMINFLVFGAVIILTALAIAFLFNKE